MTTSLSNLNFFIPQTSLLFRFAAIAHVGDFLVPRSGRAPQRSHRRAREEKNQLPISSNSFSFNLRSYLINELEVSVAKGAHRHCSPYLLRRRMRRSHGTIAHLLATHWLWQSEGSQRCRSKTTGHLQPVIALITRDGHARLRAVNTVDHTAIVTSSGQVRLDGPDHRHRIWIVGRIVSVIILVVVRIVIVVRIKPGIQSKPETVVKNKEPIVEEVTMVPIPVAVPICIVTFDDTAHSSIEGTTTESWSTRTESCSAVETTMETASSWPGSAATSAVSTTAKTTTTEASSTAAVASCPSGVS